MTVGPAQPDVASAPHPGATDADPDNTTVGLGARPIADVKAFFGDYRKALTEATESLCFIGDPDIIQEECEATTLGWQDEQALYVHRDLARLLSVVLRIYVGCAEMLYGDLREVDLVKIHKRSGKVTFLTYNDFERRRLPELVRRVKINLRSQHVDVFERMPEAEPEVLYFKHRYVSRQHPRYAAWRRFSQRLERAGRDAGLFRPSQRDHAEAGSGCGEE